MIEIHILQKNRTFIFNMFLKTFKADLQSKDLKEVWERLVEGESSQPEVAAA